MKSRIGFVSNSSSTSFIVKQGQITVDQYRRLCSWARRNGWGVVPATPVLFLHTSMDNTDALQFAKSIGIPDSAIIGPWRSNAWERGCVYDRSQD